MGLAKERASFIGIRMDKSGNRRTGEGGREPTSNNNNNRDDTMVFGL